MSETLRYIFSYVCGQVNLWAPGGVVLPTCQRCTGLYVGAAYSAVVIGFFRPKPKISLLWAHGIAMLLMIPFGYHLLPQNAILRTVTGQLFAYGLIYYLLLNPADRWGWWRDSTPSRRASYFAWMAFGVPLLLLPLSHGSAKQGELISWISAAGLAICIALVIMNIFVFALFGLDRWREARFS